MRRDGHRTMYDFAFHEAQLPNYRSLTSSTLAQSYPVVVVVYDGLPFGGNPRRSPNRRELFLDAPLPKGSLSLLRHRRRCLRTPYP